MGQRRTRALSASGARASRETSGGNGKEGVRFPWKEQELPTRVEDINHGHTTAAAAGGERRREKGSMEQTLFLSSSLQEAPVDGSKKPVTTAAAADAVSKEPQHHASS